MGYMEQMNANFFISKDNFPHVLEAIKELASHPEWMSGGSWEDGKCEEKWYCWVDTNSFLNAETVEKAMIEWGWEVSYDNEGNIDSIISVGEKLGDDDILMSAIAPWVRENSYIQMLGEDNKMWRWYFTDGKMEEIHPQIIWGDSLQQ